MNKGGLKQEVRILPTAAAKADKSFLKVYCKVCSALDENTCIESKLCTVVLTHPKKYIGSCNGYKRTVSTFDQAFNEEATNKNVFDQVVLPLVKDLIAVNNSVVFIYGTSRREKMHIMKGSPSDGGIVPRCLDVIFNSIFYQQAKKFIFKPDHLNGFEVQTDAEAHSDRKKELDVLIKVLQNRHMADNYEAEEPKISPDCTRLQEMNKNNICAIFVSVIKIYNNNVFDVLDADTEETNRHIEMKILRQDSQQRMYVHGVKEVEVISSAEAYELFLKGQARKARNWKSEYCHTVFTVRLVQTVGGDDIAAQRENMSISQLSFVDIAGPERTSNTSEQIKQTGKINNSLLSLRKCLEVLRGNDIHGTSKMAPYRNCKLTHLFKNYFDGDGNVRLLTCISPLTSDFEEILQALSFAKTTKEMYMTASPITKTEDTSKNGDTPSTESTDEKDDQRSTDNRKENDDQRSTDNRDENEGQSSTDNRDENEGQSSTDNRDENEGQSSTDNRDENEGQSSTDYRDENAGQSSTDNRDENAGQSSTENRDENEGQSSTDNRDENEGQSSTDNKDENEGQSSTDNKDENEGQSSTDNRDESEGQSSSDQQSTKESGRVYMGTSSLKRTCFETPCSSEILSCFPSLEIKSANKLNELVAFLCQQLESATMMKRDISLRQKKFREELIKLEQNNTKLQHKHNSLKAEYEEAKERNKRLTARLQEIDCLRINQQKMLKEKEKAIEEAKQQVKQLDMRARAVVVEKDRLVHNLKKRLETVKQQGEMELNKELYQQRLQHERLQRTTRKKIHQLKKVLASDSATPSSSSTDTLQHSAVPINFQIKGAIPQQQKNSEAIPNVVIEHLETPEIVKSASVQDLITIFQQDTQKMERTHQHRRSQSNKEGVWFTHRSGMIPKTTGTVLQPYLKCCKSIDRLPAAEEVARHKVSKYCLLTQEPDPSGDLQTRVYKADVIPTVSGGAQFVFNEMETLQQKSPCASPLPTTVIGSSLTK